MNRPLAWLLLAALGASLPGCGGCSKSWFSSNPAANVKAAKQPDKLPDFVLDGLRTLPNEMVDKPRVRKVAGNSADSSRGAASPAAEPSSGSSAAPPEAESAAPDDPLDIEGLLAGERPATAGSAVVTPGVEYTAEALAEPGYAFIKPGHWTSATVGATAYNFTYRGDLATEPFELPESPYRLGSVRRALLPRGERKHLEVTLFVPRGRVGDTIVTELRKGVSSSPSASLSNPVGRMPPHQFFFVVLAREPEAYLFLNNLASFNPAVTADYLGFEPRHYRLLMPRLRGRIALSSNGLTWSPVAYVLWDRADPALLTAEQRQAMIDWLHWGGQLIVSGPESLEQLRGSFLEPYLPARFGGNYELGEEALESLNAVWTLPGTRPLAMAAPWSAVHLLPQDDAQTLAVGGGEPLLVERAVGRGRVVVSGFRLGQRELTVWPSFDSLVNACLLRRPARRYYLDPLEQTLSLAWTSSRAYFSPHEISRVRYLSRDLGARDLEDDPEQRTWVESVLGPAPVDADEQLLREAARPPRIGPGVAGWDDFNAVSTWARDNLREASRIEIPDQRFVALALLAYLAVLVPLNWLAFRTIRRIEWAWFAVPLIAMAATVVIVRMARLDIGFARARTEFGIVELFADYPRAHATRYTSLYTSIGTRYDLVFDDASALCQPLASGQSRVFGQSSSTVYLRRDANVSLEGFTVGSNSLGMLHSEHMLDVGGSLALRRRDDGRLDLVNGTSLALLDVRVKGSEGQACVPRIEPGATVAVEFAAPESPPPVELPEGAAAADRQALLKRVEAWGAPGGILLTAWTTEPLPGMNVEPAPSQTRVLNFVVAQLDAGLEPPPAPDENTRDDVIRDEDRKLGIDPAPR